MQSIRNVLLALSALSFLPYSAGEDDVRNGSPARLADWPMIVSLHNATTDFTFCGASIIGPRTILTAAHCTYRLSPSSIYGAAGSIYKDRDGFIITFSSNIVYPYYDPTTTDYDFAILKATADIFPNSYGASAVQLPFGRPAGYAPGQAVQVAGWGTQGPGTQGSDDLRQTVLQVMTHTECQNRWYPSTITPAMVCASSDNFTRGTSACNGDSGGPLVDSTGKYLLGVVSFGTKDCFANYKPNIYAKVDYVQSWIEQHLS